MFIGHGGAECELDVDHQNIVSVNCEACRALGGFRWRDLFFLLGGLGIIGIGAYAALMRNQEACRVYGMVMLFYGFIIGLTAILTGLQAPVISAAASDVVDDESCRKIAFMMSDNIRYHSLLFGAICILDCLGAVYAILSKQYFDITETAYRHQRIRDDTDLL